MNRVRPRRGWTFRIALPALALALALAAAPARAQLALTNLLEARIGGNPLDPSAPTNRNEIYDLLDLDYQLPAIRLGLRFETHRTGLETDTEPGYAQIVQRYAEWNDERLRLRVGNFYTILGRGLLHRSFELTGVVLDDVTARSRFTPMRDVDGVLAEVALGRFAARGFTGSPRLGEYTPARETSDPDFDLRENVIAGGQASVEVWREAKVGLGYVRLSNPFYGQLEFGSTFVELDPMRMLGVRGVQLPFYGEVARGNAGWGDDWGISVHPGDTAAVHASVNLLAGPLTLTAEWKDYQSFALGPNDPPSLVREHGFYLLNRSTHFLDANREEGYQLEGSWTVPGWGTLTVNQSRADAFNVKPLEFRERYGELHLTPFGGARGEATLFWQRGKDTFPSASIGDRTVVGGAGTLHLPRGFSASLDVETLKATLIRFRPPVPHARYHDRYLAVGLARAGWGSVALSWERTTDPVAEDPDDANATLEVEPNRFFAVTVNADLGERHDATLFVGERRGGPACTAGTCYIVEPFDGVELRLTSRF